ncbi:transcription factor with AP2 domain(s), putative [Plasmodium chabaudi adami]|uniref:Transcription factor with AP2 domain(S), putative n=1 Tax=Plasmodium chabaudi adami TaxID=5826 RepID=A0A1D3RY46_PLACE|nr:transcription factor with AP2 domain(s), putative [Plasmodium chabaudi adami]
MGSTNKNFHTLNFSEDNDKNKNKHAGSSTDEYINYKNKSSALCNGFSNKKYIIELNSDKNDEEIINSYSFEDEKKTTKRLNSEPSLIIEPSGQDRKKAIWDDLNYENSDINSDGYMKKYFEYFNSIENEGNNYKDKIYNTLNGRNKCIDATLDLSSATSGTDIDVNHFKNNFEINNTQKNEKLNIHVDNNLINNYSINNETNFINENQNVVKKNDTTKCEPIFSNTNINNNNEFIDLEKGPISNFDSSEDSIKNQNFMNGNIENRQTSIQGNSFDSSIESKMEYNIKTDNKIGKEKNYIESEKKLSYLLMEKKIDEEQIDKGNINDVISCNSNSGYEEKNAKPYTNLDTLLNSKMEKETNFEYLKNMQNEKSDYFDKNQVMKKLGNSFIKTNTRKYYNYKYKREKMNFSLYKNQYTNKNYNFYFSDDYSINKKKTQRSSSAYTSRGSKSHSSKEKNYDSEREVIKRVKIKNMINSKYRKRDESSEKENSKFYSCISNGHNECNDIYDFHYSYSSQSIIDEENSHNEQFNTSINYKKETKKNNHNFDVKNNFFLSKKSTNDPFNNNCIDERDGNYGLEINDAKCDGENGCTSSKETQDEEKNMLSKRFENNKNIKTKNNTNTIRKKYFFRRPKKTVNTSDGEKDMHDNKKSSGNIKNRNDCTTLHFKKDSKFQNEMCNNNSYIIDEDTNSKTNKNEGKSDGNISELFNEDNNNIKNSETNEIDIFNYEKSTEGVDDNKNNSHTNIDTTNVTNQCTNDEKKEKGKKVEKKEEEDKDNSQVDEIHKIVEYIMHSENVDFSKIVIKNRKNNDYIKINFFLKEYISKYNELEHSDFLFCFGESSEDDVIYEKKKSITLENQNNNTDGTKYARCSFCDSICICDSPIKNLGINNGASILLNKKRLKQMKNRKVNYNAIDTMWQPHFHPHNKEFRVRYRYKGSMRLKTISCKLYGYKNSKKISILFLLRWLLCGKYIAEKTKRSRLSISDINEYNLPELLISKRKKRKTDYMKNEDWEKYEDQKNKEIHQYLNKINSFILNHYNDHNFLNKLKNIINTYDKRYKKEKIFTSLNDCFKDQCTENKRQSLTYSVKNKINEFMSLNPDKMIDDDIHNMHNPPPSIPYPHYGPYNKNFNSSNMNYNNMAYELPTIPNSKIHSKLYHVAENTGPQNNCPYCACSYWNEDIYNNIDAQPNCELKKKKCACVNNGSQNLFFKKNLYTKENEYNIYDYPTNHLDKNYNDDFSLFTYPKKKNRFYDDTDVLNSRFNKYVIDDHFMKNRNKFIKMENKMENKMHWKRYPFDKPYTSSSNRNHNHMYNEYDMVDKNRYPSISHKNNNFATNKVTNLADGDHLFSESPEMYMRNKQAPNEVGYNNSNLIGSEHNQQLINNANVNKESHPNMNDDFGSLTNTEQGVNKSNMNSNFFTNSNTKKCDDYLLTGHDKNNMKVNTSSENANCCSSIICEHKKSNTHVDDKGGNMVGNCYIDKNNNDQVLPSRNASTKNNLCISNSNNVKKISNVSTCPSVSKNISFYPNYGNKNTEHNILSPSCENNKGIYDDKNNDINYSKNDLKQNKQSINPIVIPDDETNNYNCSSHLGFKNTNKKVLFSMDQNNENNKPCPGNLFSSSNNCENKNYYYQTNNKDDMCVSEFSYTSGMKKKIDESDKILFGKRNSYSTSLDYYKDRINTHEHAREKDNIYGLKPNFYKHRRSMLENGNPDCGCIDDSNLFIKNKKNKKIQFNDKNQDVKKIFNFKNRKRFTNINLEDIHEILLKSKYLNEVKNDQCDHMHGHSTGTHFCDKQKQNCDFECAKRNSMQHNSFSECKNDKHTSSHAHLSSMWNCNKHVNGEPFDGARYDSHCGYCSYIDHAKGGSNYNDADVHDGYKNAYKFSENEMAKQMKNAKTDYLTKNIRNSMHNDFNNAKHKFNNNIYDKKNSDKYIHIDLESDENKMDYLCHEKNNSNNDIENDRNFTNNQNMYDNINNYTNQKKENEKEDDVVNGSEVNNDKNNKHNKLLDYIYHELNNTPQNCDIDIGYTSSILSEVSKDENKKKKKTDSKNQYALAKAQDLSMDIIPSESKKNSNDVSFNKDDIEKYLHDYKNLLYSNKSKLKEIIPNENFEVIKKFIKEVKKKNAAIAQ